MLLIKMENLKPKAGLRPISHKEFNEFIKGKGFKGRNEYRLKDLKAKFGFKPMYNRHTLTISSEGMSPTTFDSLRKASKATLLKRVSWPNTKKCVGDRGPYSQTQFVD